MYSDCGGNTFKQPRRLQYFISTLFLLSTNRFNVGASAPFRCASGNMITHSNRSNPATACQGVEGDECSYICDAGYLAIGRHVCQSYTVAGLLMINQSFSGGRCAKLCGASPASWSCKAGLVPVRVNISGADSLPCLSTSCYTPMEALAKLTRGNWEVWKLGRDNRTGMYIDHVNPLVPKSAQQVGMASTDGSGPSLAMECVAAALGYQSKEMAASRVLVTLQSLANRKARFFKPRNEFGWLATFPTPASSRPHSQ